MGVKCQVVQKRTTIRRHQMTYAHMVRPIVHLRTSTREDDHSGLHTSLTIGDIMITLVTFPE